MSAHSTAMELDDPPPTAVRQRSVTAIFRGSPLAAPLPPPPSPPPPPPADDREILLRELGLALETRAVPASFWACVQVADISALRSFVRDAQASPRLCTILSDNFYSIPRVWMQKPPRDSTSSSASSSSQDSQKSGGVPRSRSAKKIAFTRDRGKCVITGRPVVQVCHIFPHYLLKKKSTDLTKSLPDLWKLLSLFFDHDRVFQWKSAIFPDPKNPTDSIPENLVCLGTNIHEDWTAGCLAFKPVSLSPNGCELKIEFHWLPREPHGPDDDVDLSRVPLSSAGLDESGGRVAYNDKRKPIKSGDEFILTTHNPETHPLPSFTLLEMAWKLNQIVALSAAADDTELEDDDDDDDDNLPVLTTKKDIKNWMSEPFANDDEDDDEDDNDLSFQDSDDLRLSESSASTTHSPLKSRTNAQVAQGSALEPAGLADDA
ncbi:hypothetical protein ASPWEDRAFT_45738 [Aspergillus wentii DTO 134E9]|uniref:HNH nuclease domain-containing protein n=1 Tax=Aspergillus wentii DTO 134E9 TaxID=1073089 RepID=A0A1L9R5G5_ASPWE|nr:uncharacterized protein ASPWEDRAFT_45738 [Aspergillus wentii DTO 134E9]KAI9925327.1 hypothetical protein MW887_006255 [Aspergillus wentii]OJJ30176.1 hypothetical protein ASPWEDRAFT_45738 [Aspergillus wentii DTO 134E9]